MNWSSYAHETVKRAFDDGDYEKVEHQLAAAAYIELTLEDKGHPSYHNTQFAIAPFFFEQRALGRYAWRMVANGLGGYWQWETHNGGTFSVTNALLKLGILKPEERPESFNVQETHRECHYYVVKAELLARLVERFRLPTVNPALGGKQTFSVDDWRRREWYLRQSHAGGCGAGHERFKAALQEL